MWERSKPTSSPRASMPVRAPQVETDIYGQPKVDKEGRKADKKVIIIGFECFRTLACL